MIIRQYDNENALEMYDNITRQYDNANAKVRYCDNENALLTKALHYVLSLSFCRDFAFL